MLLTSWGIFLLLVPALAISSIPIFVLFWDYPGRKEIHKVFIYIAAFGVVFAVLLPLSLYLFGIWVAVLSPVALFAYVLIARGISKR